MGTAEFSAAVRYQQYRRTKQEFKRYDKNGDGLLDVDEMARRQADLRRDEPNEKEVEDEPNEKEVRKEPNEKEVEDEPTMRRRSVGVPRACHQPSECPPSM